jgi:hypothetical protein
MSSKEVNDAVGEAPTAQERLDVARLELQQATVALEAAELAYDIPRTVELQSRIDVLKKFITRLEAQAAIEAATEAKVEAVELRSMLRKQYADALDALAPELDAARQAIEAAATVARTCSATWATAARIWYEVRMAEWRFGLDEVKLDILPLPPVAELSQILGSIVEQAAREGIKQPLPGFPSRASDSDEQKAVARMQAAHAAVTMLGNDLHLSADLRDLFAKAGEPQKIVPADSAYIGTSAPSNLVPAGAWQRALVGVTPPPLPETATEQEERKRVKRENTRRQAEVARENADAAHRIAAEDALINAGKKKKPNTTMRG